MDHTRHRLQTSEHYRLRAAAVQRKLMISMSRHRPASSVPKTCINIRLRARSWCSEPLQQQQQQQQQQCFPDLRKDYRAAHSVLTYVSHTSCGASVFTCRQTVLTMKRLGSSVVKMCPGSVHKVTVREAATRLAAEASLCWRQNCLRHSLLHQASHLLYSSNYATQTLRQHAVIRCLAPALSHSSCRWSLASPAPVCVCTACITALLLLILCLSVHCICCRRASQSSASSC
jgi:hypothetical protein